MHRRSIALALALALATTIASVGLPAKADDPLVQWAKEARSAALPKIRKMPFEKALAYQEAINEFCFPVENYDNRGLAAAALRQSIYTHTPGLEEKARAHLMGDQQACGPAIEFVERVIAGLPETGPNLDALIKERRIEVATEEAIAESELLYKQQEIDRAAFETHAKNCKATAAEIGSFDKPEWIKQERGLMSLLDGRISQLESCKDALDANTLAGAKAEIQRIRDKAADSLRQSNLAKAEADKAAAAKAAETEAMKAEAFTKANPPVICRFEGYPKMIITSEPDGVSWLTIGKEKPVRLFVGSQMSSATTNDGVQIIIGPEGMEIDGMFAKGSCKKPK